MPDYDSFFKEAEIRSVCTGRRTAVPFKKGGDADDGRIDYSFCDCSDVTVFYSGLSGDYSDSVYDVRFWADWFFG